MHMITILDISFIISLAIMAIVVILNALSNSPSCSGTCEQGKNPCDCELKDKNEG